MKKVLLINASARTLNSKSRKLTEVFVEQWSAKNSDSVITYRELGNSNVPHITESWISAAFKPETQRSPEELEILSWSDSCIEELHDADIIVLGSPMYNWSIPSPLKAYIDQVLRFSKTFSIDRENAQHPYVGLLENKTLILMLSRGLGQYEPGEANEHMNFQNTYLKTVFNMMGVQNIHLVAVDGTAQEGEQLTKDIQLSHHRIKELIETGFV
ncbi:FMN-dependent NADH-azoreductase [Pedobacter heparinus]|uniref:FMN-dependent NADH-azoreductase n=1 Tax=Pedobacter heparinus TaxID=984 RepID=UPI00292EC3BD|nr:NAD(P)H-dependent oxidoreductase [Pedobacter heparinus]